MHVEPNLPGGRVSLSMMPTTKPVHGHIAHPVSTIHIKGCCSSISFFTPSLLVRHLAAHIEDPPTRETKSNSSGITGQSYPAKFRKLRAIRSLGRLIHALCGVWDMWYGTVIVDIKVLVMNWDIWYQLSKWLGHSKEKYDCQRGTYLKSSWNASNSSWYWLLIE